MLRVKDLVLGCHIKRPMVRAAAAMDPLAVVEAQLGIVDIWQSYVLRYMFLLE